MNLNFLIYKILLSIFFIYRFPCELIASDTPSSDTFPFTSNAIIKTYTNPELNTGYAILQDDRLLYYKKWETPDADAIEVSVIDANYSPDDRDWFDKTYQIKQILQTAQMVLDSHDLMLVTDAFRNKTYINSETKNKSIVVYEMPESMYSEFYFEIKFPYHALDNTCIRMRKVLTP